MSLLGPASSEAKANATGSTGDQRSHIDQRIEEDIDIDSIESDDEQSIYDSCEESFDSSIEATLSVASTVVQQTYQENAVKPKIPEVIVESKSEIDIDVDYNDQNGRGYDYDKTMDDESREGTFDMEHDITNGDNNGDSAMISKFNDTNCSLTRITVRSNADPSVCDIDLQDESMMTFDKTNQSVELKQARGSLDQSDPSGTSTETRCSTIDTSVYCHPSVQELNDTHVDTSVILESKTPQNFQAKNANDIVTSPLDRFQVQVLNGGSDCKVTPIDNILDSMQSPIMKAQSPGVVGSQKFVSKATSFRPGTTETEILDVRNATHSYNIIETKFQSPQAQRVQKKYPKTPIPSMNERSYSSESSGSSRLVDKTNHRQSGESFYSSNTSDPEDSNGTYSRNDSTQMTDYSASAFLPNITTFEPDASNVHIQETKPPSGRKNDLPSEVPNIYKAKLHAETPMDNRTTNADHNERTPGGTLLSAIISRTPRAAAFIEKHMSEEKDRLFQVLDKGIRTQSTTKNVSNVRNAAPTRTNDLGTDFAFESKPESISRQPSPNVPGVEQQLLEQLGLGDDSKLMSPLTAEEFDASPPIIKKLVTRDDINRGIVLINNWLVSLDINSSPSVPENVALEILGETFNASQVKRIFLSLCSLQRMMISRKTSKSGESVMHYVVL